MGSENFSGIFNGMDWTMDRHMNYTHSSPTSSAESAGNGPHVFTPCSFDEDIGTELGYHGFNNPGAPSLIGNYGNGRGWIPADSHSPSNVQATFPCPNCRTHIKLNMAPDTDPTPLNGGSTFKNTAPDPRQYQRWSNSLSDPIATIAPGTTMSMPPASIQPAAVVGGGYGQQGAFHRQQQPTVTQPVPSMGTRGATTGTGSMLTYDSSSGRTSTANPNSPSSYCDSSSDHSSPNEGNNNNKRKRLENLEKPARDRKSSSSTHIRYVCTVDECNKTFGSKKECERHQKESRAHPQLYTEKYFCEEKRCPKHREPFTRKDNLERHNKAMHGDYS